jgi:VWFA-related protein
VGSKSTALSLIRASGRPSSGPLLFHSLVPSFLFVFLFLSGSCRAQQEQAPSHPPTLRSTAELVKMEVSVLGKDGNFVSGLAQKDFRILDGTVEQPIEFFLPIEAPAQVLVLVETSPAVYLIHQEHLSAAYALLEGLTKEDQVALVTYDRFPHPLLPFTPDKSELASSLGQIQYTLGMGDLNLFDSISTVLDWMRPVLGKKAIVLLSTGLDSSPPARWDALVEKLRQQDVVIFPVALGGSLRTAGEGPNKKKPSKKHPAANQQTEPANRDTENPLTFAKADAALNSLAKITGGRAYFPQSAKDFVPMYREIASALRHQYLLGIAPAHDGKFHPLSVQALESGGTAPPAGGKKFEYRVFAREGYLAPGP